MTAPSYSAPTHELLYPPQRHWDADAKHFVRQTCAYCTHHSYSFTKEAVTNRFFCGTCVSKNNWPIAAKVN